MLRLRKAGHPGLRLYRQHMVVNLRRQLKGLPIIAHISVPMSQMMQHMVVAMARAITDGLTNSGRDQQAALGTYGRSLRERGGVMRSGRRS